MSCILFHFYIKPQRFSHYYDTLGSCILFHFYIKPQQRGGGNVYGKSCILFHFYIKPQLVLTSALRLVGCILFHFYIKPQQTSLSYSPCRVVSYSISTSNHNSLYFCLRLDRVVSYSISTSNHNIAHYLLHIIELYLIPFLHQTTTSAMMVAIFKCCILFHFYIKPQLRHSY